jgi:hypothetical protein
LPIQKKKKRKEKKRKSLYRFDTLCESKQFIGMAGRRIVVERDPIVVPVSFGARPKGIACADSQNQAQQHRPVHGWIRTFQSTPHKKPISQQGSEKKRLLNLLLPESYVQQHLKFLQKKQLVRH